MRLTTKGRYAVTAMLDLAFHCKEAPVTLTDIASRQTISLSYLEQLFAKLRKSGIVVGVRGPGGGYKLNRDITEISVADVILAVDEVVDSTKCGGQGNCQDNEACLTHNLWVGLSEQIRSYLSGINLGDLMAKDEVIEVAERQDMKNENIISMPLSRQGKLA